MNIPTIPLSVDGIARIGNHMAARENGFFVPAPHDVELGTELAVALRIAGQTTTRLVGTVVELDARQPGIDAAHVVRLRLARESWKQLFVCVCRVPWRRAEDFDTDPGDRKRVRLSEVAQCYVPRTGRRYDARLVEVSRKGAFISLDTDQLAADEEIRFRARHDMSWHTASVRWSGEKADHPGVGVEIVFHEPTDRSRWVSYLSFASRRAA